MSEENGQGEKVELRGYVDSRLRSLAIADADLKGIPISEFVAIAVASYLKRPDLAAVPRKRLGRRRIDQTPPEKKRTKKGK